MTHDEDGAPIERADVTTPTEASATEQTYQDRAREDRL